MYAPSVEMRKNQKGSIRKRKLLTRVSEEINAKSAICHTYAPVCAGYALIWKTHNLLRYALGMRLGNLYEKRNSVARVAVVSALYFGGRPYTYIYIYMYI